MGALQLEIRRKTKYCSICDIGSVEEGKEVEDGEDRNNSKIDLGQQATLRNTIGRSQRTVLVVVPSSRVRDIGIVVESTRTEAVRFLLYILFLVT